MDEELRARLAWVRGRLRWLREQDALVPRAFDTEAPSARQLHSYFTWPVRPEKLRELEARMGGTLDPGFRAFLRQVGVGAGPYCGISWERMLRSAGNACARTFPEGEEGILAPGAAPVGGCLLISDVGYGDFVGVVAAGPARGRVVYLGHRRGVWSLGPAFLDYYQSWLNHAAARVSAELRVPALTPSAS
ncbi:SMI1/KNR4 family protein [Nocardia blacklockiae]|uniref:SMI1/KNR4 family protein n=1 Tax=Nocardia blacklockiae TaxID=480036 RepID=UPI0018949948|nr:SMI1/KNR4 family protein [Nocardia blacklockiae]MBF6173301.1 SMI1/KNR4 family protein [Nocardia blacklockiae]